MYVPADSGPDMSCSCVRIRFSRAIRPKRCNWRAKGAHATQVLRQDLGFYRPENGTLAYRTGSSNGEICSCGSMQGRADSRRAGALEYRKISPDGKRAAIVRQVQAGADIWVL
jgi:hypothetical protein